MTFLDAALKYIALGLHPIPVEPRGKRPILDSWEEYKTRQPTPLEVIRWWTETPDANVALVMGRGLMALDIDGPEGEAALVLAGVTLPVTAEAATGKGRHLFFRVEGVAPNRTGLLTKVDTRGDGGYVVAPPSVHPSGRRYEWLVDLSQTADMPTELLAVLAGPTQPAQGATASPSWVVDALSRGPVEGTRDVTCTRLAGYFWGAGVPEDIVLATLEVWAKGGDGFPQADVEKCVRSICKREGGPPEAVPLPALLDVRAVLVDTLELIRHPRQVRATGLGGLDAILGGGFTPELIYMASRPSVGKTALGLQIARAVSKRGIGVLVVTLEMTATALMRRMLAQEATVDATTLKTGKLNPDEWKLVELAAARLGELPLWLTSQARTIMQIDEAVARLKQAHEELGLIVIDYIQLIGAPPEYRDRHAIDYVSKQLKGMVIAHDVPFCVLSQLSRPPRDAGPGWRPSLQDLRESGTLEQDADTVILLHRDMVSDVRELNVAKQRDGEVGKMMLDFLGKYQTFHERGRA